MMSSVCTSRSAVGCVETSIPMRATYKNLYQWPESDVEFIRSFTSTTNANNIHRRNHPKVVDSYSCRQMYLRSYTFSKKETVPEKTRKCIGKVKDKVADVAGQLVKRTGVEEHKSKKNRNKKRRMSGGVKRLREASCSVVYAVLRRLLSCTTTVDVEDEIRGTTGASW